MDTPHDAAHDIAWTAAMLNIKENRDAKINLSQSRFADDCCFG